MKLVYASALIAALAAPVSADDISDAISSGLDAYNEGDVQYSIEELTYALQLLNDLKARSLQVFLPEPLDGWTREFDDSMSAGLGMMGGGVGAAATYSNGSDDFTITLMADNPMVAAMGGMLSNAALLTASGARIIRVGREKFVEQDGQVSTLVGSRILVQADGSSDTDAIVSHLETIDFRALGGFGS